MKRRQKGDGIMSYGLKKTTNAATKTAAIAMTATQIQIETPASFLSSMFITSFVAIQTPIERRWKPDGGALSDLSHREIYE